MAKETSDLKAKLKKADSAVRHYVAELEKRNAKLQLQVVKLEADKMERDNRIKALAKEMKENRPEVHVNISRFRDDRSPEEIKSDLLGKIPTVIIPMMEEAGYKVIPPGG